MARKTISALVIAAWVMVSSAHAEGLYAGANFAEIDAKVLDVTAKPSALAVSLGYQVSKNLAIESRLGIVLSGDTAKYDGLGQDTSIRIGLANMYGVYMKGLLPVSDIFSFYGIVGYSQGKIKASYNGDSVASYGSKGSYGAGVEFAVTETSTLHVEYAKYSSDPSEITVGGSVKF